MVRLLGLLRLLRLLGLLDAPGGGLDGWSREELRDARNVCVGRPVPNAHVELVPQELDRPHGIHEVSSGHFRHALVHHNLVHIAKIGRELADQVEHPGDLLVAEGGESAGHHRWSWPATC